jgi:serine/threonine protein kinase
MAPQIPRIIDNGCADPSSRENSAGCVLVAGATIAGKYELLWPIGTGGMGVVWAARVVCDGEIVALKSLRRVVDGICDPGVVKRFLWEARATASVRHPHVVAVREILETPAGMPVMVMELLVGESLRERLLREGRLSLGETAGLLVPVASAIGFAHHQGIVHRDLKPDNIFIVRDAAGIGVVKVLDFGVAKVLGADRAIQTIGLTETGEVLGTPNYMSPEQVFGEDDIDQRADIWALGVIAYECLSGVLPTRARNAGQVFKRIVAGRIESVTAAVPGLPAPVADLLRRMLLRSRKRRPYDMSEVVRVLGAYSGMTTPGFGRPFVAAPKRALAADAHETIKRPIEVAPLDTVVGAGLVR